MVTNILNFAVDFGILLALLAVGHRLGEVLRRGSQGIQDALRDFPVDRLDGLESRTGELIDAHVELAAKVDQLPHTWDEMHNKVRRVEERTRGAVRRAMAELEENGLESGELSEIGRQLQLPDGNGSGSPGMYSVSETMGNVQTPPTPQMDGRQAAIAFKWSRGR